MSNASIITVPVCLLPEQAPHPRYTLWNRGPATVYVDSIASVNPTTSYGLTAGTTLIWDEDIPLYAVTANGEGKLVLFVNDGGINSIVPLNSRVFRVTPPVIADGGLWQSDPFDVSAFQSLRFIASVKTGIGNSTNIPPLIRFKWFDDNGNLLDYTAWNCSLDSGTNPSAVWPVRGAICVLEIFWNPATPGNTLTLNYVEVDGYSTERNPYNDPVGTIIPGGGSWNSFLDLATAAGSAFWIPTLGPRIWFGCYITGNVTTAGFIGVVTLASDGNLRRWGRIALPTGTGPFNVMMEASVPMGDLCFISTPASLAFTGSLSYLATFPDYTDYNEVIV